MVQIKQRNAKRFSSNGNGSSSNGSNGNDCSIPSSSSSTAGAIYKCIGSALIIVGFVQFNHQIFSSSHVDSVRRGNESILLRSGAIIHIQTDDDVVEVPMTNAYEIAAAVQEAERQAIVDAVAVRNAEEAEEERLRVLYVKTHPQTIAEYIQQQRLNRGHWVVLMWNIGDGTLDEQNINYEDKNVPRHLHRWNQNNDPQVGPIPNALSHQFAMDNYATANAVVSSNNSNNNTTTSSRHKVALLLNSDHTLDMRWDLVPPVPLFVYTGPEQSHRPENVYIIPSPYECVDNRWDTTLANKITTSYEDKRNKMVWRGMKHYIDHEPHRYKLLALAASGENDDWLDANEAEDTEKDAGGDVSENFLSIPEMASFRYHLDIGGLSGTSWGGLRWKMCGNNMLVFKVQSDGVMRHGYEMMDWYYDSLTPWKHYIPVATDLSDLKQQYDWAEAHVTEAKAIGIAGQFACLQSLSPQHVTEGFRAAVRHVGASVQTDALVAEARGIGNDTVGVRYFVEPK